MTDDTKSNGQHSENESGLDAIAKSMSRPVELDLDVPTMDDADLDDDLQAAIEEHERIGKALNEALEQHQENAELIRQGLEEKSSDGDSIDALAKALGGR